MQNNIIKTEILEKKPFGIATTSIVPLRKEPSEQSEMISQILFGERFTIIKTQSDWILLKLDFDGIEGWADSKMISQLTVEESQLLQSAQTYIVDKITELQVNNLPYPLRLVPGSEIHFNGRVGNQMNIGKNTYTLKHRISSPMMGNIRHAIVSKALEYVHSPYLFGGRSLFGIDCSGLTQIVCKLYCITLPRQTVQQVAVGSIVKYTEQALFGDLAFFSNKEGQICHVGIVNEQRKIIHASGQVRIDMFDDKGLFDVERNEYMYTLAFIRNIVV